MKKGEIIALIAGILISLPALWMRQSIYFYLYALLLLLGIIRMARIDLERMEIPGRIQAYFLLLGMVRMITDSQNWLNYLLGTVAVGVFLFLVALLSGGKLGGGDVKLMAISGMLLGLSKNMMALAIGSILGAGFGIFLLLARKIKRDTEIPFGPYLGTGIYLAYLYGDIILMIWRKT